MSRTPGESRTDMKQQTTASRARRPQPDLATKVQPAQQRAANTFERILEAAAQTLDDVGIERLSTNLVCERAGLTPPALYRYFPNKYALLSELGRRLMLAQNECVGRWIGAEVVLHGEQALANALEGLLLDTYETTRRTPAGVWIMRALRAVPALQEVRLASHAEVTEAQTRLLAEVLPGVDRAELRLVSRVVVEMIYAAVEMLFDEAMDAKAVARIVAGMLASQLERSIPAAPPGKPAR
ncbi:TetR/AcrR family transcriptional regulator [Acidovorax sp. NCPPB 4044]|uniref:TetR/AcrR family transcriptional regulator n=1 Tax=Acidovorax sp. NCPPB 4044 TaxID=2940490 RepID=UPI0023032E5F|nr:TetR/AcrR family transcriptional regulator [Acidovorax sp. NCPPB 4044]MDA8519582.1 TetR/AcrR family transcriptional regulator [Acidovorax sp. NCPPB 4044]